MEGWRDGCRLVLVVATGLRLRLLRAVRLLLLQRGVQAVQVSQHRVAGRGCSGRGLWRRRVEGCWRGGRGRRADSGGSSSGILTCIAGSVGRREARIGRGSRWRRKQSRRLLRLLRLRRWLTAVAAAVVGDGRGRSGCDQRQLLWRRIAVRRRRRCGSGGVVGGLQLLLLVVPSRTCRRRRQVRRRRVAAAAAAAWMLRSVAGIAVGVIRVVVEVCSCRWRRRRRRRTVGCGCRLARSELSARAAPASAVVVALPNSVLALPVSGPGPVMLRMSEGLLLPAAARCLSSSSSSSCSLPAVVALPRWGGVAWVGRTSVGAQQADVDSALLPLHVQTLTDSSGTASGRSGGAGCAACWLLAAAAAAPR